MRRCRSMRLGAEPEAKPKAEKTEKGEKGEKKK